MIMIYTNGNLFNRKIGRPIKRNVRIIMLFAVVLFLKMDCEDDTSNIIVKNNLSSVVIGNVKWGGIYVTSEILPGESGKTTISSFDDEFGKSHHVSFYMKSGSSTVFLRTVESYKCEKNKTLKINISDDTTVENPVSE